MSRQNGGKKFSRKTKVPKKSSSTKKTDSDLKQDISKVVAESLVEEKGRISFKPTSQKSLVRQVLSADFTNLSRNEIIKNVAYAILLIMFGSFSAIEHKTNSRLEKELASKSQQANELIKENATFLEKSQSAEMESIKLKNQNAILPESKKLTDKKLSGFESTMRKEVTSKTNLNGEKGQITDLVKNYVHLVPWGTIFALLIINFSSLSNYIRGKIKDFLSSSEPEIHREQRSPLFFLPSFISRTKNNLSERPTMVRNSNNIIKFDV